MCYFEHNDLNEDFKENKYLLLWIPTPLGSVFPPVDYAGQMAVCVILDKTLDTCGKLYIELNMVSLFVLLHCSTNDLSLGLWIQFFNVNNQVLKTELLIQLMNGY